MDGILYIDKQAGWTSFDVVAKVRGLLRAQTDVKRPKVGHCGTLDPNATGLLLIVTGSYCKRAQEFSGMDKSYEATIRLGITSTTGDDEGEKTEKNVPHQPDIEAINTALSKYSGTIQQTPPAYSAVKVGGKRAYALARAGKTVKIEPRTVTIHQNDLVNYEYPWLKINCRVSSGTYIRSLAADIGVHLETGAYLHGLRRTSIGPWSVTDAEDITAIEGDVLSYIRQL